MSAECKLKHTLSQIAVDNFSVGVITNEFAALYLKKTTSFWKTVKYTITSDLQ